MGLDGERHDRGRWDDLGKLLKTFGAGLFVSPHKLTIDDAGNRPSGIFNSQGPNSQSGELEAGS